jgi:hypothetical protein
MVRLCLGIIVCCAITFGSFGCTGQNIEGSWLGPMPFEDAKSCRIKIYSDRRFDVACGQMEWTGAGKYERNGDSLRLTFSAWVHRGQPQRINPDLHLTFSGEGNTLHVGLAQEATKPLLWRRQRL